MPFTRSAFHSRNSPWNRVCFGVRWSHFSSRMIDAPTIWSWSFPNCRYFAATLKSKHFFEWASTVILIKPIYLRRYNETIIGEDKEPWEVIIFESILFNLIEILLSFDYGDEIGRQRLQTLAVHLLTTNPCNEHIIESLVKICEKLIPNSDDRLQTYVDVIRSLIDQDSLEKYYSHPSVVDAMEKDSNLNLEVASLKFKLIELKEEETKFIKVKDYASVSRLSEEYANHMDRLVNLLRPLTSSGSVS